MGRTPCCDKSGLKKGPWRQEEDLMLINYINTHGPGNWRNLPKNAGTNCYMNLIKFFFSNVLYLLVSNELVLLEYYYRSSKVWQELSSSMDKLFET